MEQCGVAPENIDADTSNASQASGVIGLLETPTLVDVLNQAVESTLRTGRFSASFTAAWSDVHSLLDTYASHCASQEHIRYNTSQASILEILHQITD